MEERELILSVHFDECVLITLSCLTLCNPMDCSLLGFSVDGILQARILEWIAITFSRRSPQPRDQTLVSCITGRFFTIWATGKSLQFDEFDKCMCSYNYIIHPEKIQNIFIPPEVFFSYQCLISQRRSLFWSLLR